MSSSRPGSYKNTAREARKIYGKSGISVILFLIFFGLVKEYILIPLMGRVWSFGLSTTPDGFIGTSNLVNTLLKSPWIILFGVLFLVFYAVLAMWQAGAMIIGVGYMRRGQKIRLRDIIRHSLHQLKGGIKARNWMILVYCMVIVPIADIYSTNDIIGTMIIPEYIQEFIETRTAILIISGILGLFVAYVALRWFFLLPSFVLKNNDFKAARDESRELTSKGLLVNALKIVLYSFVELIRLSIVPLLLIMLPVFICYCFTHHLEYSTSLYNSIGIVLGKELVKCITNTLVQISTMCFMVELYFEKLEEKGMDTDIILPELKETDKNRMSITSLQIICSIIFSLVLAGAYLVTVKVAQTDSSIILEIFGRTEIIAHKGYCSKAPENTMPAFELADKCDPVSYIELDVWTTKDGIPVVIHNPTITDATGVDEYVYNCTYEELQKLPAPYFMPAEDFPDARIPGLEEVMAKYAHSTPLLIEIKGYKVDPKLPEKIVTLMKKYNCEYTSMIHSGNYAALAEVKRIDPDICCGYIMTVAIGNYYDLPYADFFSVEHNFVNRGMVSTIHKRGKEVFAWTVNYPSSAEDLRFTGVDGLITDVPDEIGEYVNDTNEMITNAIFGELPDPEYFEELMAGSERYRSGDY